MDKLDFPEVENAIEPCKAYARLLKWSPHRSQIALIGIINLHNGVNKESKLTLRCALSGYASYLV